MQTGQTPSSGNRPGNTTAVDWQTELERLLDDIEAPGAVFAVLRGGDVSAFAAGVANLDTAQPMTTDTLFPVASVSKVYTATLAMQLVDEGLLELDRPVRSYLPEFRVADRRTSDLLTARHLLSHTSGLDGDKFDSFGRGDDAIERYVADCATLGQVHPLGATFSYCNSGMIVLGRLIEVLRGTTFEATLAEHLLEPLGATRSGMLPEDLIWRRLAAGHILDEHGEVGVFHEWENDRAHGPAGGVVTNAEELLAFVRMHLDGGTARDGARLLSAESVAAMRASQVELPNPYDGTTHWGLGWELDRRPGRPVLVSHGGDLFAHHALMTSCPEADFAVALLVNGDGADHLADRLFRLALAEVGASPIDRLEPPPAPATVDVSQVAGTYETLAVRISLVPAGGRLEATFEVISERLAAMLSSNQREQHRQFVPITDSLYLMSPDADTEPWAPVVFYESDGQRYLHAGSRAIRAI